MRPLSDKIIAGILGAAAGLLIGWILGSVGGLFVSGGRLALKVGDPAWPVIRGLQGIGAFVGGLVGLAVGILRTRRR